MLRGRKSAVGLDIGGSCIKAVEITRDKFDYIITGYGQIEVPNESARPDAIRELFHECRFRTKKVVTAVSGKSVIVRYINMPQMTKDNLRNAIRFEADKYIPFDIDDVQLDCQKLCDIPGGEEGKPADEMKVLLVAVKKSLVDDQARMLSGLGLQPVAIDVDVFAIGNAYGLNEQLSPGLDEEKILGLVDIGSQKTCINILKDGVSLFAREVYLGGNDFTNAITRRLGVDLYQAETLKKDPADREAEVKEALAPVIEDLGNEISLSFDFFENQYDGQVQNVYLSGGSAMIPHLEEEFEVLFEKKTRVWNPIEGLKIKSDNVDIDALNGSALQLAVGVGLAARAI
ncbi:MAG: type IV pilus assembly protein PilM [Planctomycetota bacterium]